MSLGLSITKFITLVVFFYISLMFPRNAFRMNNTDKRLLINPAQYILSRRRGTRIDTNGMYGIKNKHTEGNQNMEFHYLWTCQPSFSCFVIFYFSILSNTCISMYKIFGYIMVRILFVTNLKLKQDTIVSNKNWLCIIFVLKLNNSQW